MAGIRLVLAWAVIGVVYCEDAVSMVTKWYESGTFAHGFLIPPVALYLVWRQRSQLAALRPTHSGWGLALLPAAGFVWLIGELGDILVLKQLAVIAMLELVTWSVLGSQVARVLRFPLVFLWFAVPVGEFLVSPLQDFTAWFAVGALRLSGIPVLWEGRSIRIPSGDWLVAEACSGVRYVIPSFVLGMLYAWITYRSWRRRGAFVALALLVPVVANGLRAYLIIMLAHLTANRVAVGVDHLIYGWLFFGVVMFLLFLAGGSWRETPSAAVPAADETGSSTSPPPYVTRRLRGGWREANIVTVVGVTLVLIMLPSILSVTWFVAPQAVAVEVAAPAVQEPWQSVTRIPRWRPQFVGADGEGGQTYVAGEHEVEWYLAYYAKERQGAELISSENQMSGDRTHWSEVTARATTARVGGTEIEVSEQLLRSATGETRLIWTWYWVAGEFTANQYYAKLMRVKARLLRDRHGAAVIMLATDNHPDARSTLQDFLDHCPPLHELLRGLTTGNHVGV